MSFLLVVRPSAPSSFLLPSSKARSHTSFGVTRRLFGDGSFEGLSQGSSAGGVKRFDSTFRSEIARGCLAFHYLGKEHEDESLGKKGYSPQRRKRHVNLTSHGISAPIRIKRSFSPHTTSWP